MKTTYKSAAALVAFLFFAAAFSLTTRAATYTVTNAGDTGQGSLRAAIGAANSTPDDDTIDFNIQGCENGVCIINLSSQLVVGSAASSGGLMIFNSTGAGALSIRGIAALPAPTRVLEVSGGGVLTIEGVTVSHGGVSLIDNGGGVYNGGALTLKNCVVSDNKALTGAPDGTNGAGIYNAASGVLTLIKTTVANNTNEGGRGAGIYNEGGSVTIIDSTVNDNSGVSGGIYSDGTLTITNSSIFNNFAFNGGNGGGIGSSGTLTITGSNVFGNNASGGGGGVSFSSGTALITDSNINGNTGDNDGGGIAVTNISAGADLTLRSSTVGGNRAANGGGVYNDGGNVTIKDSLIDDNSYAKNQGFGGGIHNNGGSLTLLNSTVSRNLSPFTGSGIFNGGEMFIINSTVSRNVALPKNGAAGIYTLSALTIRNSIVADNFADYFPDIQFTSGAFTSKGNNLIGNTETFGDISWQPSDILNQSPRLAPLGNYGGATQTLALTGSSPALNAGNDCVVTANGCGDDNPSLPTDARGAARVGAVDIGAFELNNAANGGNYRAATPGGKVGVPFNYLLTPESGNFSYAVTAGSLPPGLVLSNSAGFDLKTDLSKSKEFSRSPSAGAYSISGTPTLGGTFNYTITATDGANSVSTDYATTIQAPPTAARVTVGGRVTDGSRGIANAQVVLIDSKGQARFARTNSFGRFSFAGVAAGETYTVDVRDRRYSFAPQIIALNDEVADLLFAALNEGQLFSNKKSK